MHPVLGGLPVSHLKLAGLPRRGYLMAAATLRDLNTQLKHARAQGIHQILKRREAEATLSCPNESFTAVILLEGRSGSLCEKLRLINNFNRHPSA